MWVLVVTTGRQDLPPVPGSGEWAGPLAGLLPAGAPGPAHLWGSPEGPPWVSLQVPVK